MEPMTAPSYQRARHPAQKEERRVSLVKAAERLLRERGDMRAFTLTELAREAGMAKSNVYRYFHTRESLLLELLEDQWQVWLEGFTLERAAGATQELPTFCAHVAESLGRRTLLCTLMAALPSLAAFRRDFSRDLGHTLLLLARGITASRNAL